jgi:hypothetical protein
MAITTTIGVPTVVEAGNNYNFQETFTDFPASAWSMQFVMQLPGVAANVFNASAVNTNSFQVNLSNLSVAGRYTFSEYVTETSSSQRTTAKTGVLEVIPNLTQTQALSSAATMLALITTAITNLTTGGFLSVSVNNVSYTRQDVSTLISMRTRLQAEVIRERQAADAFRGIETSGRISTRFKC